MPIQLGEPAEPLYFVRQPILDESGTTFGYQIRQRVRAGGAFGNGEAGFVDAALALTEGLLSRSLDVSKPGRPTFVRFERDALCGLVGTLVAPTELVVDLSADMVADLEVVDACRAMDERGYAIGLTDFSLGSAAETLIPFMSFLAVDARRRDLAECAAVVERYGGRGLRLIVIGVETVQMFEAMRGLGYHLFQGRYFGQPASFSTVPLAAYQQACLRLLGALNDPHLTLGELEEIVKTDATLVFRVLRSVNSAASGLHREVASIHQALLLLGRDAIRKWVLAWTLARVNASGSEELLSRALVRARCAEALGDASNQSANDYFLLGLCSVLDALVGRPMAAALADIALPNTVRDALLGEQNHARLVLDAVTAYERAAWADTDDALTRLSLPFSTLGTAYLEALQWARALTPEAA